MPGPVSLLPRSLVATVVLLLMLAAAAVVPAQHPDGGLRFELELTPGAARQVAALGLEVPVTGRAFVIVSGDGSGEPREQIDLDGVPFWGMDVEGLGGGDAVVLSATGDIEPGRPSEGGVIGYPLPGFDDLPAGEYRVQAFLNVYTRFERADGHRVWMHLNSGAGQQPFEAPGNVAGTVRRLRLDPSVGGVVRLSLDRVIPPIEEVPAGGTLQQGNPVDRERVRFVKIRSDAVSRFWGRDMYLGANMLLPATYDEEPDRRYPVIYLQGHFPGRRAPFGYGAGGRRFSASFTEFWNSPAAPQVIAVTFRDANPYYDTSYSVDSTNVGPYGTALTEELIPHLEREFRIVAEPWARVVAGGSTGGWEALAMQVLYPDSFGGAWGWCPDPVDFRYHQIVDVYEDDNAYWAGNEWHRIERPNSRNVDGSIRSTMRQENHMELAIGPNDRSGGQWAIWQAVFSPVGPDGFPLPVWDKASGAIDHEVADYWRRHWDLRALLERRWPEIGPSLRGKLHVTVGDMDTYYLEEAVYLLEELLESVDDPPAEATFEYGRRQPHCWIGYSPDGSGRELSDEEFVRIAADYMASRGPAGAGWRP